jgi:hypothetical protein
MVTWKDDKSLTFLTGLYIKEAFSGEIEIQFTDMQTYSNEGSKTASFYLQ